MQDEGKDVNNPSLVDSSDHLLRASAAAGTNQYYSSLGFLKLFLTLPVAAEVNVSLVWSIKNDELLYHPTMQCLVPGKPVGHSGPWFRQTDAP